MLVSNSYKIINEDNSVIPCKFDQDINVIYNETGAEINTIKLDYDKNLRNSRELCESSGYIFLNEIIHTDIILRHIDFSKYKIVEYPVIFYSNCIWSVNFYHFLFEEIPLLLKFQELDENIPILCNYNDSYCREFLNLFKIKNPIIPRSEHVIIKCKRIIHYTPIFQTQIPEHYNIARKYLIKNHTIKTEPIDILKDGKIGVLVKRNEWERQILNHDDFLQSLIANFPDYTWVVFDGTIGLKASIELFNKASVVISPQCSATVNMIFARPGTKFFKIIGPPYNLTGMFMLEKIAMRSYLIVLNFSQELNGRHFRIKLENLQPILQKYID